MLTLDEARRRLLALSACVGDERVPVSEGPGRVLRERVVCAHDIPPRDLSTMDGYAVRAADCVQSAPIRLPLAPFESRAGGPLPPALPPGVAARILTGAPMPEGADAVVIQEDATQDGDAIRFEKAPRAGRFVRPRGQDLAAGDVALEPGTRLGPAQAALAASLDRAWLRVARRPVVEILCTGDELRDPGSAHGDPTAIPDSNGIALAAMARAAGAIARVAPRVPDDADATRVALRAALASTDVVVTVGGVSVGAHDHVRPALEAEGVVLDFWRVAIKPGKPLAVGKRQNTIVLGVPGNPASAMVTFALFGVPLLRALQGDTCILPASIPATLGAPLSREPGRLELYRARVERHGGRAVAHLLENQASGAVVAMARADALVVVPADVTSLPAGAPVEAIPFSELGL
jgi:molybdopterin molybdotransferase